MKKIVISEAMEKRLVQLMIQEELNGYESKVQAVTDYLKSRYIPIKDQYKENAQGEYEIKQVFARIAPNGAQVKDMALNHERLFDKLQQRFQSLFSDKDERDKFLNQVIDDYFNNSITKNGNLSKYD